MLFTIANEAMDEENEMTLLLLLLEERRNSGIVDVEIMVNQLKLGHDS